MIVSVAIVVGIVLGGLLFVVRSPRQLWSLIRNPREHLFGQHDYAGGDDTGMLWDGPPIPEGFTVYTDVCPFNEDTYVVIFNAAGETLWGMTSGEIWPRRDYIKPRRDEVIAYRAMTEEEIVEHEEAVSAFHEREKNA